MDIAHRPFMPQGKQECLCYLGLIIELVKRGMAWVLRERVRRCWN